MRLRQWEMIGMKRTLNVWLRLAAALFVVFTLLSAVVPQRSTYVQAATNTFTVDVHSQIGALNHFWESCVGSPHQYLIKDSSRNSQLGSTLQDHLTRARNEAGLKRERGHDILCDDVGIYSEDAQGNPVYNWTNLDIIYDFLMSIDMDPTVNLAFMPGALKRDNISCYNNYGYPSWSSPPKDWDKWRNLVYEIVKHCSERYGYDEVSKWYWEVWNEPDLGMFWSGTTDEAYRLYAEAARGAKAANPDTKIGGMGFATGEGIIHGFLQYCRSNNVPLDFFSYHDYNAVGFSYVHNILIDLAASEGYASIPILVTEWAETSFAVAGGFAQLDDERAAAYAAFEVGDFLYGANSLPEEAFAYWLVSDMFEEYEYYPQAPFLGIYGMITRAGLAKPIFNAYKMMHMMGDTRLSFTGGSDRFNGWASLSSDGKIHILIYNDSTSDQSVSLSVTNIPFTTIRQEHYLVDKTHSNAYTAWVNMGSPSSPTTAQWDQLTAASQLEKTEDYTKAITGTFSETLTAASHSVSLIVISSTTPPVNSPPVAANNTYSTYKNAPLTVAAPGVLSNDTDADNNPLTAVLVSTASHGSLSLSSNGSFNYTPTAAYIGSDNFTYKANDGMADSNVATVTITVNNRAPVAANDSYSVLFNTLLNVTSPGVLSNDIDADGDALTASLVTSVGHGSLSLNSDGSFSYTPTAEYTGSDNFTYRAYDGIAYSNTATVTITVAAPEGTFGLNNGNYTSNAFSNRLIAMRFQNNAGSGKLTKLELLFNDTTPNGKVRLGVYADNNGVPGNLLLDAGESTVVNGWVYKNGLNLSVTQNTYYWLAFNLQSTNGIRYQTRQPARSRYLASYTYGAFPGQYPLSGASSSSNQYVMRATVTLGNTPPVAVNDAYSAVKDTVLNVAAPGVLTNDSDDSGPLTAILLGVVSHGNLTLNGNGSFTYTPGPGYTGTDSFTYKANDGSLDSNTAIVYITISAVNTAPVASNDFDTTNEDTALNIAAPGVLSNDSDSDGDTLTAIKVSDPSHGIVTLNSNGSFTYTPAANYNGNDSFTYKANDTKADSNIATVTITITAVNDAPVAANDTYSTTKNTTLTVTSPGVLANDSDLDGDSLTAIKVADPSHGTVALNSNGSFTYTSSANYTGSDSFTCKASDTKADSNTATVTITITDNVVTYPLVQTRNSGSSGSSDVIKHGLISQPVGVSAGDLLIASVAMDGNPACTQYNGMKQLAAMPTGTGDCACAFDGTYLYVIGGYGTSSSNYLAKIQRYNPSADSWTSTLADMPTARWGCCAAYYNGKIYVFGGQTSSGYTNKCEIYTISSNNWTTGTNCPITGRSWMSVVVGNYIYIVGNDLSASVALWKFDPAGNGGLGSFTTMTTPSYSHGYGTASYVQVNGEDRIYVLSGGGGWATAEYYKISDDSWHALSTPPSYAQRDGQAREHVVYNGKIYLTCAEDSSINFYDAVYEYTPATDSWNSTPVCLTNTAKDGVCGYVIGSKLYIFGGRTGSSVGRTDAECYDLTTTAWTKLGQTSYSSTVTGAIFYKTADSYDNGFYIQTSASEQGTWVTLRVTGTSGTITGTSASGSGTNPNPPLHNTGSSQDYLWIICHAGDNANVVTTAPTNYSNLITKAAGGSSGASSGTAERQLTAQTEDPGSFTLSTSRGWVCWTLAVSPGVLTNAPVAANDTYTTAEDTALNIAALGVLSNDSDSDGDTLTATKVSDPSHGIVTLNSNGSFTYTPAANYNGSDSFTYKANDTKANSNIATVTITITAVNDAPVAANDAYSTTKNTALTVAASGVLSNDTDIDSASLTAIKVSDPSHGTVTLNSNGSFTYTPSANYTGSDSFTYKANDGSLDSNTATVTITISAVNTAPVASNDSYTTAEDTTLTVAAPGVLSNDIDSDGDALTAIKVSNPSHGTVTLNSNGSFTYTPAANYNGSDNFTYKANDTKADSNTATVSITITPVNDAPVAANDTYSTTKNTALTVAAPGVLSNDTDIDSASLTAIKVSDPSHGTVTLSSNGSFTYTPSANYTGTDSFTYKANDGSLDSNIATVSITITDTVATFGLNSGNTNNDDDPNYLSAVRFQNTAGTGTLTKLEILVNDTTPNGKVRLGVYADNSGKPGALLLDAGEVTVTNGWVGKSGLSLAVTQGTYYWLAYNIQSVNTIRYQSGRAANSNRWVALTYGVFPAQYPSGSSSDSTQTVMRATVSLGR